MIKTSLAVVLLTTMISSASAQNAIRAVGSSTVYPFTTAIAETLGKQSNIPVPIIESTGTGGGFKLFCAGTAVNMPSVANASRAIKESELKLCAAAGVKPPLEIKLGKDAIVLASSKKGAKLSVTREQIYLALALRVPNKAGAMIDNPYKKWSDIDSSLPNTVIEVLGPPPTSGTRDSFIELGMEPGCHDALKRANVTASEQDMKKICFEIRQDGAYVDAGENDNLIVRKLIVSPNAYGIFGFSFLEENLSTLQGATIDGVEPTYEQASSSKYPLSRDLYIYIKREHLESKFPGLQQFVTEAVSEKAIGEDGYLAGKGLVPLDKKIRDEQRNRVK